MNGSLLEKYNQYFLKLNRGFNKGMGYAPHKPILLLSVIQLIQSGIISSNRIFITPELVLAFKENWQKLVETPHTENFALPFFHLRSERFWRLITYNGIENLTTTSKSIKSFKALKDNVAFAEIDKDLFACINDSVQSMLLTNTLLDTYFPNTKKHHSLSLYSDIQQQIEMQILNEPKEEYQSHIKELKGKLNVEEFEEEIFIRGGLFKRMIPKIYNNTCCISGMKIETSMNIQMIDACHIVPFSISNDDTIPNGISLSPNLHRAFDRGLITINKDYVVRVSPTVKEKNSVYSISQFEGYRISLPEEVKWYPSIESITWHNKEVFIL
jgi:putative restriction endonuclease